MQINFKIMKKITLAEVKANPYVNNFISQTEKYLIALGYTDHGFRHVEIVSQRCMDLAKKLGMSQHDQELAGIVGYCHDMANFLGRTQHHYWAAMLFSQVFIPDYEPEDISRICQAIVSHDKDDLKIVDKLSAILILADKSDVHRSRVVNSGSKNLEQDIHDRVNYAATGNSLTVDKKRKNITLKIQIDTNQAKLIDYFEIFIERMTFCRLAAKFLGYKFILVINNFRLS